MESSMSPTTSTTGAGPTTTTTNIGPSSSSGNNIANGADGQMNESPELSSPTGITEQEIGEFREQDRVLPVSNLHKIISALEHSPSVFFSGYFDVGSLSGDN
ncbi:hypothetical protein FRC18_007212 [Serendipita sp. 400]|nr:hypothetical protein FRC18_007212 [Serendipita sp. 400]